MNMNQQHKQKFIKDEKLYCSSLVHVYSCIYSCNLQNKHNLIVKSIKLR